MNLKRDKRDIVFSEYIRERANWKCERCGTPYPSERRQGLHCSHFYGRRHRGTRWEPNNAFAHCYGCHRYFTANPQVFSEWVRNKLGMQRFNILAMKARTITKYTNADLEFIYQQIKGDLHQLKSDRLVGGSNHGNSVSRSVVVRRSRSPG